MGVFIILILFICAIYLISETVNKRSDVFEPYFLDKEVELIGTFYCDPRVKITKGKHYLVLDEECCEAYPTANVTMTLRYGLIKDDQEKLSWIAMSHFKIVENV